MDGELPQYRPEGRNLPKPRSKWRGFVVHAFRLALLTTIVWLVRDQHVRYQSQQAGRDAADVSVEQLQAFFPTAASISEWDVDRGERHVLDPEGKELGYFVQTSPASDKIVGYSGPTNVLLAFGTDDRIVGMQILSSRDTRDHVADVLKNEQFMRAYHAMSWEEAAAGPQVDGVSGATLTSLAIIESIMHRLGGEKPSLKFPEPIVLGEVTGFFPEGAELAARAERPAQLEVLDAGGQRLGRVTTISRMSATREATTVFSHCSRD